MNYALVENGVVTNVIWLHPGNVDEFPNAIPIPDGLPAGIGDAYVDGDFYRDGEKLLTAAEIARAEMADMQAALANLGVTIGE